ncbi:MFS transporter [Tepidiforma sp.]|uniref:MFS transporter n=1 Tax=Tepidiforma sp. TaxID=2682230 RepID=UPI002ADE09A8|nr:MFS transporter [Tepidiforma sp.]
MAEFRPPPPAPRGASRPSFRAGLVVFRNRHYRSLWLSSLFSFTGMQMQMVARALLAWHLTGSFGAVGLISLSFGLPMLLFSLVGGSLADRFEKRNLTLASQSATGLLALINALMLVTDTITIGWLFVLGLGGGTAMALGMPARMPLMVYVVGPQHLMAAMAMSNAAMNFTRLFGPALAGVMVGAWNLESVYFFQAGLYGLACLTLLTVPTGLGRQAPGFGQPARQGMWREIGDGLRYVARDARLRTLNLMMFTVAFLVMPYVMLLAGFVQEDLGQGEREYGFLQSVSGAGALLASLVIASLTEFDRKALLQWVSGLVGGAGLVALALGSQVFGFAGALAATLVLGLSLTAYQTINSTLTMEASRPEFYGRVMSINMLSFSAMPLMAWPLGQLADVIGARAMFTAQGLFVAAFMVLMALFQPGHIFGRLQPRAQVYASPAPGQGEERPGPAIGA